MLAKRIRLSLPANGENLILIRQFVDKFIEGTPFHGRSAEIRIAMSEACTNVIRHAYDVEHSSSFVTIYGSMTPFTLMLSVKDTGNGLVASDSKLDFPGDGGYGLAIMRELSDKFLFEAVPGSGTTVSLTFYRPVVPTMLKQKRVILSAAAAAMVAITGSLFTLSLAAPSGTPLHVLREPIERGLVRLPLGTGNQLNMSVGFIKRHLSDSERLYSKRDYGLLESSLIEMPDHLQDLRTKYREVGKADQYEVRAEVKKIRERLLAFYKGINSEKTSDSKFLETHQLTGEAINNAVQQTGEILSEKASGGFEI